MAAGRQRSHRDENVLFEDVCRKLEEKKLYLSEDFTLEMLASEVASNRTYVTRALKSNSLNFCGLVNSLRARHAIDLILRGDCRGVRLVEIAEASGFASTRTMNRYIKRSAGVSACALRYRLYGPGRSSTAQPWSV